MKKILILAYDFPPYNSIGGQRPYSWYKYFKEFDLYPIVVTRHWDNTIQNPIDYVKPSVNQEVLVVETEFGIEYRAAFKPNLRDKLIIKYGLAKFGLFRKILSVFYMLTEFNFAFFDSKYSIFKAAQKACIDHKIDMIIATGEPFILFKYANKLSAEYGIPWIADYRDGWSTNHTRSKFQKKMYRNIEKKLIASAVFVSTVSNEFKNELELFLFKPVETIYNGFFEEKFAKLKSISNSNEFIISFAGTLYSYQPIEKIIQGLIKFSVTYPQKSFKVQFVGLAFYEEQLLRVQNLFAGSSIHVEYTNRLTHNDTISLLQESSVLLLPANKLYPQVYAKVFDYLALQRNIILCDSDNGTLEHIIRQTNSGKICSSADDVCVYIEQLYNEWQSKGVVWCKSSNYMQYSRKNQAKEFTSIIKKASSN